ncbi:MAG: hypothetical protein AAF614_18125 [Chloroflexota bacterium]
MFRFRFILLCLLVCLLFGEAVSIGSASTSSDSVVYLPIIRSVSGSRGYLTTPQELAMAKQKGDWGIEPYETAVTDILALADTPWLFNFSMTETCPDDQTPLWNYNKGGTPILYAKALAYHMTGNELYAVQVKTILQTMMRQVVQIDAEDKQCRLNFGWGTPELVATADLLESYWHHHSCVGPLGTEHTDLRQGAGSCKRLFQNWLVKNPYYVVSYSAGHANSNWGAAATTTTAYIADYLADRPDAVLVHRNPRQINDGEDYLFSPAEAYAHANRQALDRMSGYKVDYGGSNSCDLLDTEHQSPNWEPVKSQITENGIIPEDTRREEFCNVPNYNGEYQNYPQLHLGLNLQQCELMLRRGDRSCYDNVDNRDLPNFSYIDSKDRPQTTHLKPGRGSIERAIKAVIVDANTEWQRESALFVAYRYYREYGRLTGFEQWAQYLGDNPECSQDLCFTILTHALNDNETYTLPPTVPPPGG